MPIGFEVRADGLNYWIAWETLAEARVQLVRADATSAYGWRSEHYGSVRPAVSLLLEVDATGDVELRFRFQPLG